MSHTGQIIKVDSNGGIDVRGDIAYVLGVNSGDVMTLYTHNSVKWGSRYKPVPWSRALNPQGTNPVGSAHPWNTGEDGDFGIKSNTIRPSAASTIASIVDGNMNGWSYVRDTIARVLDFDGYNHGALSPFGTLHTEAQYSINNYAPGEAVGIRVDGDVVSSGTYQLSVFGDIKIMGYYGGSERTQLLEVQELYVGVVVFYYYNSQWKFQKCIILQDKLKDLNPPHLYSLGAMVKPDEIANWPVSYRLYAALFDTNTVSSESGLPTNGYNIVPVPGWNYQDLQVTTTVGPGIVPGTIIASVGYDDDAGVYYDWSEFEFYIKGNDHSQSTVYVTVELHTTGGLLKTLYSNAAYTINPGATQLVGKADRNLTFGSSGTDNPPYFYIPSMTNEQFYENDGSLKVYIGGTLVLSQRFYRTH